METALFGMVMLAMGWLVLWCCADHARLSKTWWPFDFRLEPVKDTKKPRNEPAWRQGVPQRRQQRIRSGS